MVILLSRIAYTGYEACPLFGKLNKEVLIMIKVSGPVPYGNCEIRDKIGNTTVIISTDYVKGISQEEIQRRYEAVQKAYFEIEGARAIYELKQKRLKEK